ITGATHNTFAADVGDKHRTGATRFHGAVERSVFQRYAITGGLRDGILLGVYGPNTMLTYHSAFVSGTREQVADFVAVRESCGGTHVAGAQYSPVEYHDASAPPTIASGSLADRVDEAHEVLI